MSVRVDSCADPNRPVLFGSTAKTGENMEKIKIEQHTFTGGLWFTAWLFTIGFVHLSSWKGVLAIVLWAYYLGAHFSLLGH